MTEGAPFFSVIIPVFNAEDSICKCIQSVLDQTFSNFEIIIIDDGSHDRTKKFLQRFDKKAFNIKIVHQDNQGVSFARNVGLELSSGDYIAFLDADDFWLPQKLTEYFTTIEKHKPDILYSNYTAVHSESKIELLVESPPQLTRKMLLQNNWIGMSTAVVRRGTVKAIRFRKLGHEDYDFWLQIFSQGSNILAVRVGDEPLCLYQVGSKSVSSNKLRAACWHWKVLRLHERIYFLRLFYFLVYALRGITKLAASRLIR